MSIGESELNKIRTEQEKFMDSSVILRKKTFLGDDEFATEVMGLDIPARITPGFGRFTNVADRFQGITPYTVTFAHDQEVEISWEIVGEQGEVYQVRDVRDQSTYQTAKQVLADRIH